MPTNIEAMKDLFTVENPPEDAQRAIDILNMHTDNGEDVTYAGLAQAYKECYAIGYIFEYYLDAEPYGLRPVGTPLNELEGYEQITNQ